MAPRKKKQTKHRPTQKKSQGKAITQTRRPQKRATPARGQQQIIVHRNAAPVPVKPAQPAPDHPVKVEPEAGVAVSVTTVPFSNWTPQ